MRHPFHFILIGARRRHCLLKPSVSVLLDQERKRTGNAQSGMFHMHFKVSCPCRTYGVAACAQPTRRCADHVPGPPRSCSRRTDRTSVGEGTGVSVRVELGGWRVMKKKKR